MLEGIEQLELVIALMLVVLALTTLARRLLIPYPILLVIGGLALSFVPGLPSVRLDPDLVFLVFLPPILWAAAYFTALRDFRANLRPIMLLAVGLVIATTAVVAGVARAIFPGMPLAAAIALGAIVSPPDAVAAAAIARRLRIPRRVITILEGESLVNDASALVLYRAAVGAAVVGSSEFALGPTVGQFLIAALGGIAVGLAIGEVARWALRLADDGFTEIAITLLAPYAAWILGERLHVSAVLACVVGGLYLRRYFSALVAPATRIQGRAVWDQVVFLLNGLIFILIGLQLATLRESVSGEALGRLVWQGAVVSAAAIVVRLVWVFVATYLPRWLSPSLRRRDPIPQTGAVFLVAWTGMRGIVSLAAALALPITTRNGEPFPYRAEIILLTFAVILSTLVLQGLSLTPLIRRLGLRDDESLETEEAMARERGATAALARIDELASEGWALPAQADRLRVHYASRVRRYSSLGADDPDCSAESAAAYRRLRHEAITAERDAVIALRNEAKISDETLHRLEHELDVESLRIGVGDLRGPDRGRGSLTESGVTAFQA